MAKKDGVGRYGERVALRHVEARGWQVLDTNWRGKDGELDIVALDGDVLVVVEVKTRSSLGFGHPAEAVTPRKLARIKRLTGQWLTVFRERLAAARLREETASGSPVPVLPDVRTRFGAIRIDVVAVTLQEQGPAVVEHLEAVA
ncbi:putative endonuclease [Promicromonospora sp. AC04]|uniref:YraN family protein n=1 Tax=Promicromonospora sp. AC04 TaxID=2135723 RepID=UPI000D33E317|nr:YraN family protein [Promicromonospora sp. AC04]PUB31746.1 putative endonuclease [Promicromonospora sp. AC04]